MIRRRQIIRFWFCGCIRYSGWFQLKIINTFNFSGSFNLLYPKIRNYKIRTYKIDISGNYFIYSLISFWIVLRFLTVNLLFIHIYNDPTMQMEKKRKDAIRSEVA
jgi:hypothetical protein